MIVTPSGRTLVLRDGRRLRYGEYGKPDGEPGFYFHGHPGSRLEAEFADAAAAEARGRIIALDRQGYSLSDFQPGRTILDRPARVLDAVAEAMSPVAAEIARRPEVRNVLGAVIAEAFRQGSRRAALDVVLLGRPWGFRREEVRPVVFLWQGEADVLMPPAMGRQLAATIPNCHATFFPEDGHLLFDHSREIAQAFAT